MTSLRVNDIVTATEDVWLTMLNLAPRALHESAERPAGPTVAGVVHISGASNGAVTVQVSARLADLAASAMFRLEHRPPTHDEQADAIGELTNMVGGSLKGLMNGPSHLSLPAVIDGAGYQLRIPRGRTVNTVSFDCEGERFVVTVVGVAEAPAA